MNAWVFLLLLQGEGHPLGPPDRFAGAFTVVRDQNGDGCAEIAVADRTHGGGTGSVWLLSGKDGRALWQIHGSAGREELGRALATVRDADGVERALGASPSAIATDGPPRFGGGMPCTVVPQ